MARTKNPPSAKSTIPKKLPKKLPGNGRVKKPNFFFTDKKFTKKAFFKLYISSMVGFLSAAYWIYEFAMPTPDVAYDMKRWMYPEFEAFVVSKGLATYDPLHNAAIRNFHYMHKCAEDRKNTDSSDIIRGS